MNSDPNPLDTVNLSRALVDAGIRAAPKRSGASTRLRCQIGRGDFLLPLASVIEIVRASPITAVPQTPPWISGLMNLRGRVLPVLDLAVKFGEPRAVADSWTCFVIVETGAAAERLTLALIVARVHEVVELGEGDLEPAPPLGARLRVEFIDGLRKTETGLDIALNLDLALSAEEVLTARAAAARSAPPAP
jgi:purine-binding chemotaxis protein CheW